MRGYARAGLKTPLAIGGVESAVGQSATEAATVKAIECGHEGIAVNASRREGNSQRTPLGTEVWSPDGLRAAGAGDAKYLALLVPGLQFDMASIYSHLYFRDIGNFSGNALRDSAVMTSVDCVFAAGPAAVSRPLL